MAGDPEQAAKELVERMGAAALPWMRERIADLSHDRDPRALDDAYRVLTVVERLLARAAE